MYNIIIYIRSDSLEFILDTLPAAANISSHMNQIIVMADELMKNNLKKDLRTKTMVYVFKNNLSSEICVVV